MNRITILKIPFSFGGINDAIYPVVLRDEWHMVLVDCGYVGFLKKIERAMENEGLHCKDLTHVLITHHDHDHMGTLSELKRTYPQIRVVTSRTEKPYINGECKPLRLVQAEAMQPSLPPEQQAFGRAFCEMLAKVQPVSVDDLVQNDECLPWCGGCVVVATPGHTKGHISLYLPASQTLIAGDAAVLEGQTLTIANPQYALDIAKARQSLNLIIHSKAKRIICYHGGVMERT